MKTIEEKRSSVLAYCEEVCPKGTKEAIIANGVTLEWIDYGDVMTGGLRLYGVADWMYIEADMDEYVTLHAYRLLGLETRDALAPYKSENERLQSAWMAEQSPSDALLWEAWKKACEFEFKDEFEQTDEEDAFNEWRATLPTDPLKADSELEADKALADEVIWKDSEVSAGHMSSEIRLTLTATCNPLEVFEAIERLCK